MKLRTLALMLVALAPAQAVQAHEAGSRRIVPRDACNPFAVCIVDDRPDRSADGAREDVVRDYDGETLHLEPPHVLTERDVTKVSVQPDTFDGWAVEIQIRPEAGRRLARFTTDYVGRKVSVCLGGTLLQAPVIRAPIVSGQIQIASDVSEEAAKRIAARLDHLRSRATA